MRLPGISLINMKPKTLLLFALVAVMFMIVGTVVAAPTPAVSTPTHQATEIVARPATQAELEQAYAQWSLAKHSETFDTGLGANTNCARCKSPTNWDPFNTAVDAALDCYSCKRLPGEPRPELAGSVDIAQKDWNNIGCEICHQPIGDSFSVTISYWDQYNKTYIPVDSVNELCAKCHEGLHGFEVLAEQAESVGHNNWQCTACHGPHGEPSSCTDCHDPLAVAGAEEHARHPSVNCTGCHDAGSLNVWKDPNPLSKHFNQYVPERFAHTPTSWPSHNIAKAVNCKRCHHPGNLEQPVVAQEVSCEACHPDGAVLFWCPFFPRDGNPNVDPVVKQ
jgi:hypothetical protein